jgi:RND family efflux transporter MFP subunit
MNDSNAHKADLSALKIDRTAKVGPPGRWKRWLHLLWLLMPVILYIAYNFGIKEVTPALKVKTARVQMSTGTKALTELVATGYVVAQINADVSSKATGRLKKLKVEEGDNVNNGDIIAELENDDIRAERDLALANLKRSQADSVEATLNYSRQKRLFDAGHISKEVFDAAEAAFRRAAANVEAMEAGAKAAEVALENTIIRAPFAGTVLAKHADVGEMVAPFASASSSRGAVATIADMSSLEVEADVSESNINKVTPKQPCEIVLDAYPDVRFAGHVKKIVPTADRTRATVMTKVAFDNIDSRVLPEMSARVNFLPLNFDSTAEAQSTKTILRDALTSRDNHQVVFKLINGVAQEATIQIGRQLGNEVEILSGLDVGEEIILAPPGGLKTGDKIEVSK